MAWSAFTVTPEQVQLVKSDIFQVVDSVILVRHIATAKTEVESILKGMIYTKFRQASKTIPDDLPTEKVGGEDVFTPLNAILSDGYEQARAKIICRAIYHVYFGEDPDMADQWDARFRDAPLDEAFINIDVDESGDIDDDEHLNIQRSIDSRVR